MFTDKIQTINMDGMDGFARIDAQLRALITTLAGTLPGSRGFGIEDYTDENTYDVEGGLAASIDEGCERYIPEIGVERVAYEAGADGRMAVKVYVGRREEY